MRKFISVLAILGMLAGTAVMVTYDGQKVRFQEDQNGSSRLEGTMNRNSFQLNIITAPIRQIHRYCLEAVGEAVPGCSMWSEGVCTIWTPDPIGLGDWTAFHIAGHEIWHCKIGHYHD